MICDNEGFPKEKFEDSVKLSIVTRLFKKIVTCSDSPFQWLGIISIITTQLIGEQEQQGFACVTQISPKKQGFLNSDAILLYSSLALKLIPG